VLTGIGKFFYRGGAGARMDVADGCACWTSLDVIHGVVHFDGVGDFSVVFGVFTVNRLKMCYSFGGAGRVFGAYGDPLDVAVDFAERVEAWSFDWQGDLEVSGVGVW
jgi:hypothetical protein